MNSNARTCWISERARFSLLSKALEWHPLETGGLLVGYTDPHGALVVADVIGPGQAAAHKSHGFVPDHGHQQARLAELYHRSGRTLTYLGDWHTHPNGNRYPSPRDKRVLRRIARTKSARLGQPIMGVVTIDDDTAELAIWRYVPYRWTSLLGQVAVCTVTTYTE